MYHAAAYVLRMLEKQYKSEGKNVIEKGSPDRRFQTLQSSGTSLANRRISHGQLQ